MPAEPCGARRAPERFQQKLSPERRAGPDPSSQTVAGTCHGAQGRVRSPGEDSGITLWSRAFQTDSISLPTLQRKETKTRAFS